MQSDLLKGTKRLKAVEVSMRGQKEKTILIPDRER
jgi:hypothetical protein